MTLMTASHNTSIKLKREEAKNNFKPLCLCVMIFVAFIESLILETGYGRMAWRLGRSKATFRKFESTLAHLRLCV